MSTDPTSMHPRSRRARLHCHLWSAALVGFAPACDAGELTRVEPDDEAAIGLVRRPAVDEADPAALSPPADLRAAASPDPIPLYVDEGAIWPSANIPLCWETPGYTIEKAWVRDALQKSWENASAVRFSGHGMCTGDEPGLHVRFHDAQGETEGLGSDLDGVSGGVTLNRWGTASQPKHCAGGFTREDCVRASAVHELGHALGFAHEQNRPDAPSGWSSLCDEQGANGNEEVGAPDINSVMNYCNPVLYNRGKLSDTDILGVRKYYSGNVHIHQVGHDGAVGGYVDLHEWPDGWSSVETYYTPQGTFILLLNATTGDLHIHRTISDGSVGPLIFDAQWSSGWTSAQVFTRGSNNYLLMLKEATGQARVYRVNNDGKIGAQVASYQWSAGWTTAHVYNKGDATYLLLLKKSTGDVHIHRLNDSGTVGTKISDLQWSTGWTTVTSYYAYGATYLLLMKESTGDVHIQRLNDNGTVGAQVADYDWSSGWSTALTFVSDFDYYVLLLKRGSGTVQVRQIDGLGKIGTLVSQTTWSSGWTSANLFVRNNQAFLFFLKK